MPIPKEKLTWIYETMYRIRRFEERLLEETVKGNAMGVAHTSDGEEAGPTGICAHLTEKDWIGSTHRGHGHCIAKGGDVSLMMAELLGKATGYCKGKGGSMHIADVDAGILGANGIVGGGIGIATGAALSCQLRGTGQVCICFFGEGGVNQGALYENANIAAIWKLPVIYLCENNQYAMSTSVRNATSVADLSSRAAAFGIAGASVDGMDVLAVYETVSAAVERARRGEGPSLVIATTYRYEGHNVGDAQRYRTREEVATWREQDPIQLLRRHIARAEAATDQDLDHLESDARGEVESAVEFARTSPEPDPAVLLEDVYA